MTLVDATEALIALGANLPTEHGEPIETVPAAMEALAAQSHEKALRSRLFRTPAFPAGSGPDFVNAAMRITWTGDAPSLLALLHRIEQDFGRTRSKRWEARVMDLDLIGFGQSILPDRPTRKRWAQMDPADAAKLVPDQLILPHPRLSERAFVLVPMADIAPDWTDPETGRTVRQMISKLPVSELAEIVPLVP